MEIEVKELIQDLKKTLEDQRAALESKNSETAANLDARFEEITAELKATKTALARSSAVEQMSEKSIGQSPEYKAAFTEYLKSGKADVMKQFAIEQKANLNTIVDAEGGIFVPDTIADSVMTDLAIELNPLRQFASVRQSTNGTYRRNRQTQKAEALWVGEQSARTVTDVPRWAKGDIYADELMAQPEVTLYEVEDSAVDVYSLLRGEITEAFAVKEGEAFLSGDGINKPEGIMTFVDGSTAESQTQIATIVGSLTADTLIDISMAPKARYRANSAWVMNRATLAVVRKLKDANNNYIFNTGDQSSARSVLPQLLGYPVIEMEGMDNATTGLKPILFGDLSGYVIVDRVGLTFTQVNPFINPGFVRMYTRKRVGAGLVDGQSLRCLQIT